MAHDDSSTFDLTGKTAVVTGGGSGVGSALCRRLSDRGALVFVADVDVEGADRVATDVGGVPLTLDVRARADWDSALSTVVEQSGSLDVLALNAGVMTRPKGAPMGDDPIPWMQERYDHIRAVNVDGVAHGVLAALGYLERTGGRIVVTASVAGLMPQEPDPAYSMSKHAVIGLVRSLGAPLAERGVYIGAVCPGGVDTPLVPPDLRTGRSFAPPDHVAAHLVDVLDMSLSESGGIWISYGTEQALWRYDFAPVREGPST
ncbi:MAG: SDR family oxidoreductase [Acidimicrobiales bacterium]